MARLPYGHLQGLKGVNINEDSTPGSAAWLLGRALAEEASQTVQAGILAP